MKVILALTTVMLAAQVIADESTHHTPTQNETTTTTDVSTTSDTVESNATFPPNTTSLPNRTNHEDIVEDMD